MGNLRFSVYDAEGNNVTGAQEWYIDQNGNLYYFTSDVDCPLAMADDYTYKVEAA